MTLKVSLAALVCMSVISLAACEDEENPLLETSAGKLAAIDAGTTDVTESQVRPYTAYLDKLVGKCNESQTGISDTAVQARKIIKARKGTEVSTLSVMRMIDSAIPPGAVMNCDEVIAAIIALS